MSYEKPTLSDFLTRFPVFAEVGDDTVSAWLDDGDAETAAWPDDHRAKAVMLYAAHNLAVQQKGAIPVGITSFKSGTFSATVSSEQAARTGLSSTEFGRAYLDLMRRYFAGPRMAWSSHV